MYETHSFFPISPQEKTSHTQLRKMFYEKKIHHPQDKLIAPKKADTGIDPKGGLDSFMKKDIKQPIRKREIYPKDLVPKMQEENKNKWAVGTTKRSMFKDKIAKEQPFDSTFYYSSQTTRSKSRQLRTDNITMKSPKVLNSERSLESKWKFGVQLQSSSSWAPKIVVTGNNNRSSVPFNIISNAPNPLTGSKNLNSLSKTFYNRKPGMGEFSDLTRPFRQNFDPNFSQIQNENKHAFKKFNGIFSQMYHDAQRNGNLVMPFKGNH